MGPRKLSKIFPDEGYSEFLLCQWHLRGERKVWCPVAWDGWRTG